MLRPRGSNARGAPRAYTRSSSNIVPGAPRTHEELLVREICTRSSSFARGAPCTIFVMSEKLSYARRSSSCVRGAPRA
eukprot:3048858-Pleurochrysis_carterae.AAC.2